MNGSLVSMHYTGTLENGTIVDSTHNRNKPVQFKVGAGEVIRGFDDAVIRLSQGSKAIIICPPEYAFGSKGVYGIVPPDATIKFEVEVMTVHTYDHNEVLSETRIDDTEFKSSSSENEIIYFGYNDQSNASAHCMSQGYIL